MVTNPVAHYNKQEAVEHNTAGSTDVPAKASSMNSHLHPTAAPLPTAPARKVTSRQGSYSHTAPDVTDLAEAVGRGAAEAPPSSSLQKPAISTQIEGNMNTGHHKSNGTLTPAAGITSITQLCSMGGWEGWFILCSSQLSTHG